ncbi:MAG: transcription antitermination factor NusB [Treponema sp.]|nr:transcription antitermination factor NusB [Treponema sp.]
MASRRKGRILAFQALYSWDVNKSESASIPQGLIDFSWAKQPIDEQTLTFSRLLLTGTIENINAVDDMIKRHLQNWEIERLNRVDLAIIRMSTYTLMFQSDMPPSIIIDEAVDISKEFGTDDSYRFVNGVLDSIKKTLLPGEST